MTVCYIGLGSNMNQPLQQLNKARNSIHAVPGMRVLQSSSIYQSKAITLDGDSQDDYLNAVIKIETEFTAEQLLDSLLAIENDQGRKREKRWGARTIDLDILLYGDQIIQNNRLTVPHAEIENRGFVLLPLHQVASDINIPGKKRLKELLNKVSDQDLVKVDEFDG